MPKKEIIIQEESCVVIKHYKVKLGSGPFAYNEELIHNETTGEIALTLKGMSINNHNEYYDSVVKKFKKQMNIK